MIMVFKRVFDYLYLTKEKKKNIVKRIANYSRFFKNGFYFIDCSSKIIYRLGCQKQYKQEKKHTLSGAKDLKRKFVFLHSLFDKKIIHINNRNNANEKYTMCILSYDHCVFLNPKKEMVLSLFNSKSKRDDVLKRRNDLIKEQFNLPNLIESTKENAQSLKERFIKKIEYKYEDGIISLLNFYIHKKVLKSFEIKKEMLLELVSSVSNNFKFRIDKLVSIKHLMQIISHGDCNYNNYIFDGVSFFFIDYDRSGMHFFFCDCIFFGRIIF